MARERLARLDESTIKKLRSALGSQEAIAGLTHTFYKYPARFSPAFARTVIEAFTKPGDLVMDPFMGGGTTLVEALASGRLALGCDLNPLAGFLTSVKTSPLNEREATELLHWRSEFSASLNLKRKHNLNDEWSGYDIHVPWWLRKTIQYGITTSQNLATLRQRNFARCTLARTAQWALDCRKHIPGSRAFLEKHEEHVFDMLSGDRSLRDCLYGLYGRTWRSTSRSRVKALVRSAAGLHSDKELPKEWPAPRLIITSPPYVGVHILYHRWQVKGRRETPAPYWIIGKHNGMGASHYTFGDRGRGLHGYMPKMSECFKSIHSLMNKNTLLVQLVAFSQPDTQLPKYCEELSSLGFVQAEKIGSDNCDIPRERQVPNRKWYADARGHIGASREFLLMHYKR